MASYPYFNLSWDPSHVENTNFSFPAMNLSLPKNSAAPKPQQPPQQPVNQCLSVSRMIGQGVRPAMIAQGARPQMIGPGGRPAMVAQTGRPTMITQSVRPPPPTATTTGISPVVMKEPVANIVVTPTIANFTQLTPPNSSSASSTTMNYKLENPSASSTTAPNLTQIMMPTTNTITHHFLPFQNKQEPMAPPAPLNPDEKPTLPSGIFNIAPITEYLIDESEFVIVGDNFECQQCGYSISSKRRYMMKNHILAEHKGVRHKCRDCNYEGKSREKLNAHMKRVHYGISSNPQTMEYFIDESEFVMKENNFVCQHCGYKISNKRRYMMRNHILSEHKGVRHKCNECNYEGKSREKLNAHMKRVHFNVQSANNPFETGTGHQCDRCDFRTGRGLYELNLHIQAEHEGVKHFCSQCSFSSKRKDIVQRHMKQKHLGVVFNCDLCSYSSSWKYSLQRHVARCHGTESGVQTFQQ